MKNLLYVFIALIPTIIAAIFNMIFCKSNKFNKLKKPIDNYMVLKDKERLFGDNKTYKGFIGYIVFNIITAVIWGYLLKIFNLSNYDYFYINNVNNFQNNLLIGFLLGLAYALFELPNSFLKRRLKMKPGINYKKGFKKYFFIIDQIDSILGTILVVWLFNHFSLKDYLLYVLVGALIHICVNYILYTLKIRKNMF